MAKISEETRLEFAEAVKPYQSKITVVLNTEKTVLNAIASNKDSVSYKKNHLSEDMIYAASLYMAQNTLSLKILEVKNNDVLNEARKILYKAIIYLEDIVTNTIDLPYSELASYHEELVKIPIYKRY